MAFTEALRLLITADASGAIRSIQDVGRTSERELSRSEKSLDRWGSRLTTVGAGMVAFGAVAAAGLHEAAQSASDLGEAVNASNVVFGSAIGTIDKYAETSATSMGLSERAYREALVPIGAMLQNVGLSQEEAAEQSVNLAQRAADMASVFNTDVSEALAAIQAGLRGEADPLERFGVGLTEAAVNAKAVELGLAATTSEVDASAKAQARLALIFEQTNGFAGDFANTSDSLANRQRVLSARFEDLKAEIGAGVIPVMETLFGVASKGIDAFTGLNNATGGALGKVATIATVASLGVGGLSFLVGQAIKMRDTFGNARIAVADFAGSGGLGKLARVAGAAGAAGAVFGLIQTIEAMREARLRETVDELAEGFVALGDSVDVSTIRGLEALSKYDDVTGRVFDQLVDSNVEAAERFVDTAEKAGIAGDRIDEMRAAIETKRSADAQGKVDQEAYTDSVDEAAGAVEEATSALQEYSDSMKALTDPVFAAMDAVTGLRDAQVAVADAERGVLEAQAELDTAIRDHGRNSSEAAEATLGLQEAQRALEDAQWATVTSAAEADSALAGLQDAVENGDVSVDAFMSTLEQWVRQGFLTEQQAARAAMEVAGLGDQARDTNKERVDVPVSAPGAVPSRERLTEVRDAAHSIPGSRNTHVTTSGTFKAVGELDSVARAVNRVIGNGNVHVSVGGGGGLILHEGGIVPGRRGQEVAAILQAGEEVIAINDPRNAANARRFGSAGAGGGVTVINNYITNVAGSMWSEHQLMEVVNRNTARNNGRNSARPR